MGALLEKHRGNGTYVACQDTRNDQGRDLYNSFSEENFNHVTVKHVRQGALCRCNLSFENTDLNPLRPASSLSQTVECCRLRLPLDSNLGVVYCFST